MERCRAIAEDLCVAIEAGEERVKDGEDFMFASVTFRVEPRGVDCDNFRVT